MRYAIAKGNNFMSLLYSKGNEYVPKQLKRLKLVQLSE